MAGLREQIKVSAEAMRSALRRLLRHPAAKLVCDIDQWEELDNEEELVTGKDGTRFARQVNPERRNRNT
ncbi:hypothetical protein LTR17_008591 [Elasticomyces elasticus]|nr:hypothetical protein LTR17_008591 [Elasticomyces elasticus]